jgi:hypothetical protein
VEEHRLASARQEAFSSNSSIKKVKKYVGQSKKVHGAFY